METGFYLISIDCSAPPQNDTFSLGVGVNNYDILTGRITYLLVLECRTLISKCIICTRYIVIRRMITSI